MVAKIEYTSLKPVPSKQRWFVSPTSGYPKGCFANAHCWAAKNIGETMVIVFYIALLIISLVSATILVILIHKPIEKVFTSLAPKNISHIWTRIVIIAIYVLSLYGGIDINRIVGIKEEDLSIDRWAIEIINTVIHSLMDPLSMIVFLFMICLVAIGILRVIDKYIKKKTNNENALQKRINERAKQ